MATKIAVIHNSRTRFVAIDLQILSRHFDITEIFIPSRWHNPASVLRRLKDQDLVFGWFASWHTLLPVLFSRRMGQPAILIIGGYDTADVPQAGYGSQRGGLRKLMANLAINRATHLVTHSQSSRDEVIRHVGVPEEKITVIYLGIPVFPAGNMAHRQQQVLTVGGVKRENLLRKGLLPFVQTAARLPDVKFYLVGKWFDDSIDALKRVAGPNVDLCGYVPDEELEDLYRRSAVYVQASLHEGFGMSLAEAMMGGCIPVITGNGSLPEVVGDTGVVCSSSKPGDLVTAVAHALTLSGESRQKVRERIMSTFPLERRESALVDLIVTALANCP